jgi:uncharacterized RDD family membrane protein YckC
MIYPVAGGAVSPVQQAFVIASFGRRFAAFLLDVVGIAIVAAIVVVVANVPGTMTTTTTVGGTTNSVMITNSGWSAAIVAGISAAYFIICWVASGATFGQRLLGLHVFGAAGPKPLRLDSAVVRWFILLGVSSLMGALTVASADLTNVVGLVQLVWVIVLAVTTYQSPTKQGLHDRLAGSFVVRG